MLIDFVGFPLLALFALADFSHGATVGETGVGFTDARQKHRPEHDVGRSKSQHIEFNINQAGPQGVSQPGSFLPIPTDIFGPILEENFPAGLVYDQSLQFRSKLNRARNPGYWSNRIYQGFPNDHVAGIPQGRAVRSRKRRVPPTLRPEEMRFGGLNLAQGLTYTWTRDFSSGKSFDEAAFKSVDKNVVVVMSFDNTLKDSNLTASSTVYDFTGTSGIMAIKPRSIPGPCYLVETSLTYDKIISELDTRNGSSVLTSTVISLDGTGSPVSLSERLAILKKTPTLARQCRGRKIIRTRPSAVSRNAPEIQTTELKVLTMDAEMSITVPVDPDLSLGPERLWLGGQAQRRRNGEFGRRQGDADRTG